MSVIPLQAGVLSLVFLPGDEAICYVHAGPHEILRGVGAPIRDQVWMTVPPEITDVVVTQDAAPLFGTFTAHCRANKANFRWRGGSVNRARTRRRLKKQFLLGTVVFNP